MVLEGIFGFLLGYPPVIAVLIFSIFILVIINIFYKVLIKQDDAKALKERSKEISKEMKEAQKAGKTEESKKLMGEMMNNNSKLMRMTMKPMLVSLIVVMIFLPTMNTFYGDKFAGVDDGQISLHGVDYDFAVEDGSISVAGEDCNNCIVKLGDSPYRIALQDETVKFAQVVATTPIAFPVLGDSFGWLGWYIITSFPIVVITRKFMKIHV